jgi:ERCC4-related helicase
MVEYIGKVAAELPELAGRGVHAMHGQMVQKKRTLLYEEFVRSETGVLIATDLIARGVDIPDVDCILQYDAPQVQCRVCRVVDVQRCSRALTRVAVFLGGGGRGLVRIPMKRQILILFGSKRCMLPP